MNKRKNIKKKSMRIKKEKNIKRKRKEKKLKVFSRVLRNVSKKRSLDERPKTIRKQVIKRKEEDQSELD